MARHTKAGPRGQKKPKKEGLQQWVLNAVSFLSLFSCIRTKTLSEAPGPAEDYISQRPLHPRYHVTKLWPMIFEKPHTVTGPRLTRGEARSSSRVPFFGNRSRLPEEIGTAETINIYHN